jgi:hypothetical protein
MDQPYSGDNVPRYDEEPLGRFHLFQSPRFKLGILVPGVPESFSIGTCNGRPPTKIMSSSVHFSNEHGQRQLHYQPLLLWAKKKAATVALHSLVSSIEIISIHESHDRPATEYFIIERTRTDPRRLQIARSSSNIIIIIIIIMSAVLNSTGFI